MQQDLNQEPQQESNQESEIEPDSSAESEISEPKVAPIIAFTSGKGGCGKTTLAVNLANVVAQSHHKVLLIDLDLRNKGTSGMFSRWTNEPHRNLTLTRLLRDEVMVGNKPRMLTEIKPGFYLMPASSLDESEWTPERGVTLAEFVEDMRTKILELAERFDISFVALDCHSGTDLLATAGAVVADHTIIVNEPDVVTFSESVNLLNHLEEAFSYLQRKPELHFVVNRLKGSESVTQLSLFYKENLESAMGEIALCYFPYNERVAETFGKHPFISDLIPRSLFVRKLELLTSLLFKGSMDHLIKSKVSRWSERKIRYIYGRSVDNSVADSRHLALKFANFSLLAGLWLIVSFILLRTFSIGPIQTWIFLMLSFAAASAIIAFSILHGFGLAALRNFGLAIFRFRFGRLRQVSWSKIRHFLSTVIPVVGGLLMSITVLAVGAATIVLTGLFLDWTSNVGVFTEPDHHFKNRLVKVAMSAPIRTLDLRDVNLKYTDLSELGSKQSRFIAGNTTFQACQFGADALHRTWNDCVFNECSFVDPSYTRYKGIEINRGKWVDVAFTRFVSPQLIIFEKSDLRNSKIQVGKGTYIKFLDCTLNQTVLITGEDCFMAFREKVEILRDGLDIKEQPVEKVEKLPDGLRIRGQIEVVPEEEFEALTSKLWPELSLAERIRQKKTSLESAGAAGKTGTRDYRMDLAFLIEYYILSGRENYLQEANGLIEALSKLANDSDDVDSTGLAYMLRLLISIVDEFSHEVALSAWSGWLETNGGWSSDYQSTGGSEYDRMMEQFWYIWNEHLTVLSISDQQRQMLSAIKASAQGRISAEGLKLTFAQVIEMTPAPQE